MTDLLPADTRMSEVALDVADLDAMARFYADVLLLERLAEADGTVTLGRDGRELVVLRHRPDLPRGERRSAGLFHTALLHPDAESLATVLASVAMRHPELYTGSGDHLVSQAFYLDDPEGNGVELYVDRPRSEWNWHGSQVAMDTLWLDPNAFLAEHLTEACRSYLETAPDRRGALAGTDAQVVGHVHLKVGQTARAKDFYVDALGFEVTAELPGALFVSAGGYHHHMAMNTWGTAGVGLRAPGLGLGRVAIEVPAIGDVLDAAARLRGRGLDVALDAGPDAARLGVDDPWGNRVEVATPAA
ncbi:MAG: VOC family protein [Propionibacteriaceae bacterium]|nr:VOC family protein [Propionibacteriaceae bacterium]